MIQSKSIFKLIGDLSRQIKNLDVATAVANYLQLHPPSAYTHPSTHPASIIEEDSSNRFVSDTEKGTWNAKVSTTDSRLTDARTPTTHAHPYEPFNENIQIHVTTDHAPATAQANADITKEEIEAKLIGELTSHSHASSGGLSQSQIRRRIC